MNRSVLATALQYARPPQKAPVAPTVQRAPDPPRHDKRDPETGRFVE